MIARNRKQARLTIEALEDRVTPATLLNPHSLIFTDVDGDRAMVSVTRGVLTPNNFTFALAHKGEQLQAIQLASAFDEWSEGPAAAAATSDFFGANLTVSVVKRAPRGDGMVNVGFINAVGIDLGAVCVQGDLGRIVVGDRVGDTPALGRLDVNSLGRAGVKTQAPDGSLFSEINGSVGTIQVRTDLVGASLGVGGNARFEGEIAWPIVDAVYVGGSIRGNGDSASGSIHVAGDIRKVCIGGNIQGGLGDESGRLIAERSIGEVQVRGSLIGGGGFHSGQIHAGMSIERASIGGDIRGGSSETSGAFIAPYVQQLAVAGSLIGGEGDFSGQVASNMLVPSEVTTGLETGELCSVRIGKDIRGGAGIESGRIHTGSITNLYVGRHIISGSDRGSGSVAANHLGAVTVAGNLKGTAANPVQITAPGFVGLTTQTAYRQEAYQVIVTETLPDGSVVQRAETRYRTVPYQVDVFVAVPARIERVTVLGNVEFAQIVAGINGSIGAVCVKGDWTASSLAAAVNVGEDGYFGTEDDWPNTNLEFAGVDVGRIERIAIGGHIKGTKTSGDNFGFVALQIDQFFTRNGPLPLRTGGGNDNLAIGLTGDVRVRELPIGPG